MTMQILERMLDAFENRYKSNIDLGVPRIGNIVGTCMNCSAPVRIRQPWLSEMEEVNDGYYLIHCTNESCHNFSGVEIKLSELWIADFVNWDEKYIEKKPKQDLGNVIPFDAGRRRYYG